MSDIRKVISHSWGHLGALKRLLKKLEKEDWDDQWSAIQEEFPGITLEEYEADLNRSAQFIRMSSTKKRIQQIAAS